MKAVARLLGLPQRTLASRLQRGDIRDYAPGESKVKALEPEFAEMFGCRYALAVNSGTSALIAALVACGVGPGAVNKVLGAYIP